jgi:hypothetical protein
VTRRRALRRIVLPVALAVTVALGGCAAPQPSYDPATAKALQGEVLEVSELSAAADYTAALLTLTELEVSLKDARARGELTEERYESILAAAAMVRADLEAAIAAQAPPEPEADEDSGDDESNKGNKGDKGKGNNGKGNPGKGNDD